MERKKIFEAVVEDSGTINDAALCNYFYHMRRLPFPPSSSLNTLQSQFCFIVGTKHTLLLLLLLFFQNLLLMFCF